MSCPTKIYTPESQLPIILDVSLPPGLILGHPRSSYAWVPASCDPWCKPSPWTLPWAEADVMSCPTKIYTPESQLPIILDVSLPPGLILGHPRSSYAWVPASCDPWRKPSPWTLPWAEADVMSLVLVLSPTLSAQDSYTDLRVWTQCYPNNGPIQTTVTWSLSAGWSQCSLTRWQSPPIITEVGVSFDWHHTWVMWKITGGFRVIAPFNMLHCNSPHKALMNKLLGMMTPIG